MTLVKYRPIDDRFAELPNRVLRGMMIDDRAMKGLRILIAAHLRLYRAIQTVYDGRGSKMADRADVEALYLLMRLISEVTADAALEAQCLS